MICCLRVFAKPQLIGGVRVCLSTEENTCKQFSHVASYCDCPIVVGIVDVAFFVQKRHNGCSPGARDKLGVINIG